MAKVSELTGAALDWAVATAAGYPIISPSAPWGNKHGAHGLAQVMVADTKSKRACHYDFRPSESWSQGGPIIDEMVRDGLRLMGYKCGYQTDPTSCQARLGPVVMGGPTPLIAAMRCFVSSKLGDEVEIPDELTATVARQL